MKTYEATEQAYKNGYAKGYEDGKKDARKKGRWETTEVTNEFDVIERYHHFHRECKYSYCDNGIGGHYFCPLCGADMRGEEDG